MKLFGYEWLKLWQRRLFVILAALLLAGNLLTLYILEKNSSAFFYVCEHRDLYQAFQAGDTSVDTNGWYQEKRDAQIAYQQSYAAFIGEMASRAEQMRSTALFSDQGSFVSRNLRQTCEDFARFDGLELKLDNDFGLRALSDYDTGALFLLVFLAVLAYFVIFHERDAGLTLLLKGNRRGHTPLALSKLAAMLSAAALYALLQEAGTVLFLGGIYGYGDLSRPIQSMSRFRNCAHFLTVGQGLASVILIRVAAAVFFACLLFCVGMCVKNGGTALAVSAAALGAGYLCYQTIPLSGGLNWLKCVNPFYCWSVSAALGEYLNLDLFGAPVNKDACALAILGGLAVLLPTAGTLVFNRTYQVKSNSRLERLLYWLRGKLSRLTHRTSLLYYEFYKMMVQQKKGIVLLLLLAWGIYETASVFGPTYYASAQDASYQHYMDLLHGPVTEETLAFMEAEEERLNGLWLELMEIGDDPSGSDVLRQLQIRSELEFLEDGFQLVQRQLEGLKAKEGPLEEKLLMDERSYISLWWDTGRDLGLFFIGSASLLFFISSIRTLDERKKLHPLLRSTRNGHKKLDRSRFVCALLCALLVYVVTELPLFLRYYSIDQFATVGQRLSDFTQSPFTSGLPLWALLAGAFSLKAVSYLAVCLGGLRLSSATKNEMVTLLAGVGAVGAVTVILRYLNLDANLLLIQLLR